MVEKLQNVRKNKKGFTLVELIVVLVILAIIMALIIPALTGYIDKANEKKVQAETRQLVVAVQTELSEAYQDGKAVDAEKANIAGKAITLSEVKNVEYAASDPKTGQFSYSISASASIVDLTLVKYGKTCTYAGSGNTYTVQ